MGTVNGSLNTKTPTSMAVTGSNAPKIAAIVLLTFFKAIIKVILLIAVGTSPKSAKLINAEVEGIAFIPPVAKRE